MGGTHNGLRTMNDIARRLRTQKTYSTDPAYLERMAREEETRGVHPPHREHRLYGARSAAGGVDQRATYTSTRPRPEKSASE